MKAIRPLASWSSARWFSSFLRPADQERSVAVEPGVAGFDDPAACAPARGAELFLDLFAASADVRRELVCADELAHDRVVEGAVEAQPLRPPLGRLGPLDRDRVERCFRSLESWRLAPSCASPIGTPAASQRTERFAPFWLYQSDSAPSSGPRAAPWSSRRRRPARPSRSRRPGRSRAAPAARSRGTPRPAPTPGSAGAPSSTSRSRVPFNAFHCIPVRSTNKIASIASRSGTRGR